MSPGLRPLVLLPIAHVAWLRCEQLTVGAPSLRPLQL
jgi:hypothetical protein